MSEEFTRNHAGDDLPVEADPTVRQVQQRLADLGVEWRARPLDTARVVQRLRQIAADGYAPHSPYPLQEGFVLMQATPSQSVPAPHVARRRWYIMPIAAAVLVAVLGVTIFAFFTRHATPNVATGTPSVTTITPAVHVVSAKDFQRFPTGNDQVGTINPASDLHGMIWFTDMRFTSPKAFHLAIARWTEDGKIQAFDIPNTDVQVNSQGGDDRLELLENLNFGPDGDLWFTHTFEPPNNSTLRSEIGRMTPTGQFTFFALPPFAGNSMPPRVSSLVIGPDDNLWFKADYENATPHLTALLGRMTLTGQVTWFDVAPKGYTLGAITSGPDHHLWVVANAEVPIPIKRPTPNGGANGGNIPLQDGTLLGRMDTSGKVTYRPIGNAGVTTLQFSADGSIWFYSPTQNQQSVGHFDLTTNHITYFVLPDQAWMYPDASTIGSDNSLWFILGDAKNPLTKRYLYRLSPQGVLTRVQLPDDNVAAFAAFAADDQMWLSDFTYHGTNYAPTNFTTYIARITP